MWDKQQHIIGRTKREDEPFDTPERHIKGFTAVYIKEVCERDGEGSGSCYTPFLGDYNKNMFAAGGRMHMQDSE